MLVLGRMDFSKTHFKLLLSLFALVFLSSCSGGTATPALPPSITTNSLPSGQVGTAYSAILVVTGGTPPYMWSLTSGTLPTDLSLNPSTGAITGTPTVSVTNTPLTFEVSDSSDPMLSSSVNLTLTIASAGSVTVSISPKRAG